jgi:hypothetical protein
LVFVWCLLGAIFILSGVWSYQQHKRWQTIENRAAR